MARRFGILAMILCLFVVLFRLLRREHPNGVARAPIWRLIAVTLGTSPTTIKKHMTHIFDKVGVDTRTQLISRIA